MDLRKILPAVEAAVVSICLLQGIRVLFSSLFGVIHDAVFEDSVPFLWVALDLLLILLAMLTPLLLKRDGEQGSWRTAAVLVVVAARMPLSVAEPAIRLYSSILLLAAAVFYSSHLLLHEPQRLIAGLVAGLGVEQFLRALDFTYDPTLRAEVLPLVIGVALITVVISLYLSRQRIPIANGQPTLSAGLALGAGLFVQTSFLTLPSAISRWSETSYTWLAPSLLIVTLLPLVPVARAVEWSLTTFLWPIGGYVALTATLICVLLAALCGGSAVAVLLLMAQLFFVFAFTTGVEKARTQIRKLRAGIGVSLGFLLLLMLSFAFAFTFTYPYTLPFFRGLGTPILLIGVLIALLPVRRAALEPQFDRADRAASALGLASIVVAAGICALLVYPTDLIDEPAEGVLNLATYNIHYGYDSDWVYSLDKIAQTIEENNADVILLQEVDAGRVSSLSVDDALWLSNRLAMHQLYQPTLEKLSGIALLSRYPLDTTGGRLLTSDLEQTAIVRGTVRTTSGPLHIYGIWLGLEPDEREKQLSEALEYIGATSPAVLGGDFNSTPDSPVYSRMLEADMDDPFTTIGSGPALTSPSVNPTERIDYLWLRGVTPQRAWVSDSRASDHLLVAVEVGLNP